MEKRLKYNKETNIIEVIDEETQELEQKRKQKESRKKQKKKQKYIRDTVNFVISILAFIVSVGALGISYSQKVLNDKQVGVSVRQFELDKKPLFKCYIEQEELYDDDDYWLRYEEWLNENGIEDFGVWYHRKFPERIISPLDQRNFWDAYDSYDMEVLAELTEGEFKIYEKEYRQYLSSKKYTSYDSWKNISHVFKKEYITLKNNGAHITNARLEVYSYISYQFYIDDISYSFVIDMRNEIFSEDWLGKYLTIPNYDSGNNSFSIEYTQDVQHYKKEYLELSNLSNYLSSTDILEEIGIDVNEADVFYAELTPIYFCITYLDNEQQEQIEWYRYSKESNTLNYIEPYDSNVEVPDFKTEGFTDTYYEAQSLYVAETLGYQNAQWRPFSDFSLEDYSYIETAKRKIIADLKELVNSSVTANNEK